MLSAAWLKKAELFVSVEEPHLEVILSYSRVESYPAGTVIFAQGAEATHLHVLIEGEITLTVKTKELVDVMASKIKEEGGIFGIPSLIEPYQYNVTAQSAKPSKGLKIDAREIRKEMEKDPRMGMAIMKRLALIYFTRLNELRAGVANLIKEFPLKTP